MKKIVVKPFTWIGDVARKSHVLLINKSLQYVQSPRQQRLMMTSAAVTFGGLFIANSVYAQNGIAGMVNTAAVQGESIKNSLGKLFAAGGFGSAGYGAYNWWKKGKEGEQSHTKASQVFVPILAGAAMGAVGFVMTKAGESIGIQSSSHGQLPK